MKRSIQVISKSFLPILLVFAALYAGLLSIHLSALSDAEKVTVIQVGSANTSEWKENTVDSGQELDAYREPVYLQGIELLAQQQFAEVENRVATLAAAGNTQLSQLLAADCSVESWRDLKCLIVLESRTVRQGKESFERRYYLSSGDWTAEEALARVRGHWSIENQHGIAIVLST